MFFGHCSKRIKPLEKNSQPHYLQLESNWTPIGSAPLELQLEHNGHFSGAITDFTSDGLSGLSGRFSGRPSEVQILSAKGAFNFFSFYDF